MKNRATLIAVILLILTGDTFAQTPAANKQPATTTTATTTVTTTTPPTAPAKITITSMRPKSLVSDKDTELTREIVVRATSGLKGLTTVEIGNLVVGIADNSSDTSMKLSVKVPAKDKGEYTLNVAGVDYDDQTLTIKDPETVEHDKLVRDAAAGAAAATKVAALDSQNKALEAKVNTMATELTSLKGRLTLGVTEVKALVATEMKPLNERLGTVERVQGEFLKTATELTKASNDLAAATAALQIEAGTLAYHMPKQGGFLGMGRKQAPEVAAIATKYQAAATASLAAAEAAAAKNEKQ